jgi:hypothetical protein
MNAANFDRAVEQCQSPNGLTDQDVGEPLGLRRRRFLQGRQNLPGLFHGGLGGFDQLLIN